MGCPKGLRLYPLNLIRVMPAKGSVVGAPHEGAFFMTIVVNGNPHDVKGTATLGQLFKDLDIVPERVAVMVNDRIIPKAGRSEFGLNEGDRVEVLTFIGGG